MTQSLFRPTIFFAFLILVSGCAQPPMADAELQLDGDFIQGGLVIGKATPGAQINLSGKPVQVYADGRFLIGFARKAESPQTLKVRWPSGFEEVRNLTIAERTYNVQRISNVDQSRVTPPQSVTDRIAQEGKETRAARSADTRIAFFDQGWVWPTNGRVTGVYGSARIYNGTPGNPHWGIDIAAPTGTPVLAPSGGVVRLVHPDNYYAGGLVILDHGYGLTSSFLHLSAIHVRPGQRVAKGEKIADVGSTGRSTGPHLDWRMNLGPDLRLDVALLPLPPGP